MQIHSHTYRASTVLATLSLGLMAGFFFAFWVDVAPAMVHLDAPGYVTTQQWINTTVRNIPFAAVYFGAAFLSAVPGALAAMKRRWGLAMGWGVLAFVYFGGVFWLTRAVNVPINEAMATWTPATIPADWAQQRDAWNAANAQRTGMAVLCFIAALMLTSLQTGRASRPLT